MRQLTDHEFVARGNLVSDNYFAPITFNGSYSEFEHKPVKCIVVPDDKQDFSPFIKNHDLGELEGIAQDGENIWISALTFLTTSWSKDKIHWEGNAEKFVKGNLEEFDATDGTIHCSLYIPPTPLAENYGYICNPDGTINFENPPSEKKEITWTTKFSIARLVDDYSYADTQVGINPGITRIWRGLIHLIMNQNGSASLKNLARDLSEIFDDTLWLISFLSRKRLTWYAGDAVFLPNEHSKASYQKATIRRDIHLGYESSMGYGEHEFDLLIAPDKLKAGLFQELLTNYSSSKYHDAIRRAMIHILMSYERAYLETHVGIAYLALETLVAGLSPDKDGENSELLESNTFKSLANKIQQVIQQEKITEDIASKLSNNLAKINFAEAPSFANRLLSLLRQSKVPLERLWPSGVNVDTKLREIIRRRNLYIHKGEISDFDQYLYDFARLRTLVELWILKLLDCPDEAINPNYLTSIAPIDRIELPVKSHD